MWNTRVNMYRTSLNAIVWLVLFKRCESVSAQKQVVLTFEYVNGTLVPVVHNATETSSSVDTAPLIASVFLIIVSLLSCAISVIVVGTIGSSLAMRKLPFNILLLNLGIACIIETINMLISAAYLLTQPWYLGIYTCNFDSYFMEFVPIIYTLLLLTVILDRALALHDPPKYRKSITIVKQRIYLVLYWLLSLAIPAVVAAGILKSWPFPDRYSCQIMDKTSIFYGAIICGICFLLPWILIIVGLIVIRRLIAAEKRKEKKEMRGTNSSQKLWADTGVFMLTHNAQMTNELKNLTLVLTLLALYLFLLMPYILRVKLDQILQGYNYDFYGNLTVAQYTAVTTAPTASVDGTTTTPTPSTDNFTKALSFTNRDPNLVPEVQEDSLGDMDTVFVWLRYIHAALVPLAIFVLHKDLRKKAENLLICWRPNSVDSKHLHHINPFIQNAERPISNFLHRKRSEWEKKKKKFKNVTNYSVPVLFASSDGLYLRMVDNQIHSGSSENLNNLNESIKAQWTVDPKFVMEPCDVFLPASAVPIVRKGSRRQQEEEDAFGATITVLHKNKPKPVFKQVPTKSAEDDEGFVDHLSNSNENTPLISSDEEKKKKKLSRPNVEKKVSFQEEVLNKDEENKRGGLHLAPLPSKTSSRKSKSEKTSKSHVDDESAESKSHSRHSNHKHSKSRKASQGKKDENEEKRKKSRSTSVRDQESYM